MDDNKHEDDTDDKENGPALNELLCQINKSDDLKTVNSRYLLEQLNMHKNSVCEWMKCQCLKRICDVLKQYNYYVLNIDKQHNDENDEKHIAMYDDNYDNIQLLNDYNHLVCQHVHEFEDIYNKLIEQHDGKLCNLSTCSMMRRNQRNRTRIKENENLLKKLYFDEHNAVQQQLLDKIHCHYFHTFDIAYKLTRKEKQNVIKQNNKVNKDENEELSIDDIHDASDIIVSKTNQFINDKRNLYKNVNELHRLNSNGNKFIMEQTTEKHTLNSFDYGYRFFYWKHYKNNDDIHDDAHERCCKDLNYTSEPPIANVNSTLGDWYIDKKYENFKKELLQNEIENIGQKQWEILIEKAQIHIKTDKVKQFICTRLKSAEFYEMKTGQEMELDHIIAMLVYCNMDTLQRRFTETFRRFDKNETIKEMKKRHRNYWFLGKLLRECVECFGTKKPKLEIQGQETVFQGVNKHFIYSSLLAYIKGPLSTTTEYTVAANFTANKGMIIELNLRHWELEKMNEVNQKSAGVYEKHSPYMDMSWISDFTNEEEVFCIGGLYPFHFNTIINAPLGKNYAQYVKGIKQCTYGMRVSESDSSSINKRTAPKSNEEMIMAFRLLSHELYGYFPNNTNAHEFKSCPEYIKQLLHLHCLSIQFVTLCKIEHSKINDHFFKFDNEWIKIDMIVILFPNVTTIAYRCDMVHPKDISSTVEFVKNTFIYDGILKYLKNNYKETSLQLINIALGNIDKSEDQHISDFISIYDKCFNEYGWSIGMDINEDVYDMKEDALLYGMDVVRSVDIKIQVDK